MADERPSYCNIYSILPAQNIQNAMYRTRDNAMYKAYQARHRIHTYCHACLTNIIEAHPTQKWHQLTCMQDLS